MIPLLREGVFTPPLPKGSPKGTERYLSPRVFKQRTLERVKMSTRAPRGLRAPGTKLWSATTDEFELAEHELVQLEEACRVRDTIATLRATVEDEGTMIASSQGSRLHPAIAEIRQQQLALARLLATLNVPGLEDDALPASRGSRGVYALNGGAKGAVRGGAGSQRGRGAA